MQERHWSFPFSLIEDLLLAENEGCNLEGTKVLKAFQIYQHIMVQSQGGVAASFALAHLRLPHYYSLPIIDQIFGLFIIAKHQPPFFLSLNLNKSRKFPFIKETRQLLIKKSRGKSTRLEK